MVLELVANACNQHLAGRCSRIEVDVAASGAITVADDGPGIAVHGGNGAPPIEVLLTRPSHRPAIDGHRPHSPGVRCSGTPASRRWSTASSTSSGVPITARTSMD